MSAPFRGVLKGCFGFLIRSGMGLLVMSGMGFLVISGMGFLVMSVSTIRTNVRFRITFGGLA